MDIHTSKIGTKGQATIPADIRKLLNLSAGDNVMFEEQDNQIILRKAEPIDITYLQATQQLLSPEWDSDQDGKAYDDL